jgi:hypothetical protein
MVIGRATSGGKSHYGEAAHQATKDTLLAACFLGWKSNFDWATILGKHLVSCVKRRCCIDPAWFDSEAFRSE